MGNVPSSASYSEPPLGWEELPALFPGIAAPGTWLPVLQRHAALLEAARPRVRASAVEGSAVVRRQYAESLELLRIAREGTHEGPVVDVGSGGGFPGLVIAAIEPGTLVHLVEPSQKKARLLEELARELGMGNVAVHAQRAEDAGRGVLRGSAPLVIARAVADLRALIEYTAPFAPPGGLLVLPKGSGLDDELEAAGNALAELRCRVRTVVPMRAEISTTIRVLLVDRVGDIAVGYPRRAGVPSQRPL